LVFSFSVAGEKSQAPEEYLPIGRLREDAGMGASGQHD
jgi:hypothetical protein